MRYIRYAFLLILAIVLVTVALANRGLVTLKLLPDALTGPLGLQGAITLPLFVIIFLSIAAGLLIGFLWEWMREHKIRVEARKNAAEVHKLERKVRKLHVEKHDQDEVLALLEDPAR